MPPYSGSELPSLVIHFLLSSRSYIQDPARYSEQLGTRSDIEVPFQAAIASCSPIYATIKFRNRVLYLPAVKHGIPSKSANDEFWFSKTWSSADCFFENRNSSPLTLFGFDDISWITSGRYWTLISANMTQLPPETELRYLNQVPVTSVRSCWEYLSGPCWTAQINDFVRSMEHAAVLIKINTRFKLDRDFILKLFSDQNHTGLAARQVEGEFRVNGQATLSSMEIEYLKTWCVCERTDGYSVNIQWEYTDSDAEVLV